MSKTLAFVIEHQQQTEWCWAAVSKSVSTFFDSAAGWTQCAIVNSEMGRSDCCTKGGSPFCNCTWYLERALQRVSKFRNMLNSPSDRLTVRGEVDISNPMGARILWARGGGHFVALYGYDDSDPDHLLVVVGDPWYGASIVDFDTFTTNYLGMGSWTHSYFTRP